MTGQMLGIDFACLFLQENNTVFIQYQKKKRILDKSSFLLILFFFFKLLYFLSFSVLRYLEKAGCYSTAWSINRKEEKVFNSSFLKLPVETLGSQKHFSCKYIPPGAECLVSPLKSWVLPTNEGRTLGWMNQHRSSMAAIKPSLAKKTP